MTERRAAIVLAGSRGMGFGSAAALARRGHDVLITGRTESDLLAAVEQLRALGSDAHHVVADVRSADDLARVFALADERFGRLDTLVCNGGSPVRGPFLEISDEDWIDGNELNVMSVVRAVRHAIPRFEAAGAGRVVVIGSSSVLRPIPGLTVSNVTRPALTGLVKALALELAPLGVSVNMVSPGRVDTGHARNSDERRAKARGVSYETVRAEYEATIPMGRYGTPDEFGEVVAFLGSREAGYVTGQSIVVDGALTLAG